MAAASPSVSATPSISVADFSCRLPVSGFSFAPGGFVSFPTGSYNSEAPDRLPAIQLQPDLGLSYDQQLQRWLPVRRQQLSLGGRTFAYVNFTYQEHGTVTSDGVHVVDAATGRERLRIPNRPAPSLPWFVAGLEAAGIYLSWRTSWAGGHQQSLPTGLALADPLTGQIRPITDSGSWIYLMGGAGWGMDAPLAQAPYGLGTKLLRLDLSGGSEQTGMKRNVDLQLVGLDGAGHPLVELNSHSAGRTVQQPKLWLVTGPEQLVELRGAAGVAPPEVAQSGSILEDGHGVWITPMQPELWLYRLSTGLQLTHRLVNGITEAIADACT